MQGFTAAQTDSAEYRAGFACEDCGQERSWDIASPTRSVSTERTVVAGTRSDVVVDRGCMPPLIIEVVVAHDLEPATRLRYEDSKIPVLVTYPTWDTVAGLADAVIADVVLNAPSMRCAPCEAAEDRRRREVAAAETWARSMLRRLRGCLRVPAAEPAGSASPQVRPWRHDKFGREMYPRVWRKVRHSAAILQRLGFLQSDTKPWLFSIRLPEGRGVVFANFGSTEEVPLWEDASALVHWRLAGSSEDEERELVRQLLDACRTAGAEVRVSFYNQHFDP